MDRPPRPIGLPAGRSRWAVRCAAVVLVAVAAGLGAAALRYALELASHLLLGAVVSEARGGEWFPTAALDDARRWLLPVLLALAMVVVAALSRLNGRRVNGTDGVIQAVHSRDLSGLDTRGAALKLTGTAITLGAGGSGGTEGPVASVSAALAGPITRRCRLAENEAALLVAAALGAGVGALFQAPIGGALLAGELLRRRGIDWRASLMAVPTALIAFGVFVAIHGYRPMFGYGDLGALWNPTSLALLAGVGVVAGVLARVYVWTFHGLGAWTARLRWPPECTAAVAGALVGTVGIFIPATLGTSYGVVTAGLSDIAIAAAPLWLLAALPFVKIAATSITLQAGGVGGVFGPAMVIGASAGALCWRLAVQAGVDPGPVALFTVTGLAACLGPAVRAPWAAIMLACQSTGQLVPPVGLLLGVGVALVCARGITLFPSQSESQISRRYPQLAVLRTCYRQMTVSVLLKKASYGREPE